MIALLLACAAPEPEVDTCDNVEDTRVGMMSTITVARMDGQYANGFDLDGQIGDDSDCGIGDFIDDEGVEGIDNAFARLMPALETTEAAALEEIVQEAINNGVFVLTYEIEGYDDGTDDECVNVGVVRATGEPMIGTHGLPLSGQTFDRYGDATWAEGTSIIDGRVEGRPLDFRFPLEILGADILLNMNQGAVRVDLNEDGSATGMMGGAVPIDDILTVLNEENVDPEVAETVGDLMELAADMDVDGDGECRDLSLAFEFEAVNAFFYAD